MRRYSVEASHADHVMETAMVAFDQVRESWALGEEQRLFLIWAAQLHEIGLAISHSQFHRHGAYLIEYSDLTGFSRPEQQALAFLVARIDASSPTRSSRRCPAPYNPPTAGWPACCGWRSCSIIRVRNRRRWISS